MAVSADEQVSMARIAADLLQETLHNIVHDILMTKHREHKTLLATLDPKTKLPHCTRCNLPRLLKPRLAPEVRGATGDPPKDTQYCELRPWSRRNGHDIYDNPFPKMDVTGRPPKPSKAGRKDTDGTPASTEEANGTAPPSPSGDGDNAGGGGAANGGTVKLEKGEKKASKIDEKLRKGEYVPWHTCPTCKRSLLITRFAKHLEGCMGLSGRVASRNAMAKINGTGGTGSTPVGSRGATPSRDDGDDNDSEERGKGAGGVRKKVLKKGLKEKILKKDKEKSESKPPKSLPAKPQPDGGSSKENVKRERDEAADGEDEDTIHVKKRQKIQRVGSIASISTAVDLEHGESNDGSFVDDGSGGED